MRHVHYYILGIVATIVMASCSSSRKAAQSTVTTPQVIQSDNGWTTGDCITAHSNVQINSGKTDVSLGGTLRMKRDDVVQLNLTYNMLITVQVGTLQLTPDSVLLLSRVTHQYAVVTYPELSAYMGRPVTFQEIQKFFWGDAGPISTNQLTFKYNGFETIGRNRQLPKEVIAQLTLAKAKTSLDVQLSNIRQNSDWQTRIDFSPNRYTKVTLAEIVKMLMSAAQ